MIIKFYHEAAGHPSGVATWLMIRQKYVWKEGKMKKQIQQYCDGCTTCLRFKSGNHAQYASPRVTISAPIPFASVACDVMSMPAAPNGYDSIFVAVCTFCKYTILIPMCSKGLISPAVRKDFPQYTGKSLAWDSARLAYKLYKRLFSIFGLRSSNIPSSCIQSLKLPVSSYISFIQSICKRVSIRNISTITIQR